MKKVTWKGIWTILKEAFSGFSQDKVLKLSASLAYYTVFSVGPMIIVIIYLCDIFYGREAVEGKVYGQIRGFVGNQAAIQLQDIIRNASLSNKGHVAAVVGIITLLLGATSIFAEIQDSINTIWGLKPKPKQGLVKMLLNRLLSFSVVVSLGFLLLVSLILNALIEAFMDRLQFFLGKLHLSVPPDITVILIYVTNLIITFVITTLLFGIIFKVLPDAKIKWKDVLVGAMSTAVLFMLGKFAITFYIGRSNVGTTYGAAGSFVILLLWVYYSSVILYFGAEFTRAYASNFGHRIHPNQYAVWVQQIEVEQGKMSLQQKEQIQKEETAAQEIKNKEER